MKIFQDTLLALRQTKQEYERQHPPLHAAALDGEEQTAAKLIARGADVNALSAHGWTALHWAAQSGSDQVIALLLSHGAAVAVVNPAGDTPLHLAASSASSKSVALLLEAGASVNARNSRGETPLALARHEIPEVARRLLFLPDRNAVVHLLEQWGGTV